VTSRVRNLWNQELNRLCLQEIGRRNRIYSSYLPSFQLRLKTKCLLFLRFSSMISILFDCFVTILAAGHSLFNHKKTTNWNSQRERMEYRSFEDLPPTLIPAHPVFPGNATLLSFVWLSSFFSVKTKIIWQNS
jgi:hypothetical protein